MYTCVYIIVIVSLNNDTCMRVYARVIHVRQQKEIAIREQSSIRDTTRILIYDGHRKCTVNYRCTLHLTTVHYTLLTTTDHHHY